MTKINMTLLTNQKETLKYENIDGKYTDEYIIFNDKYGTHTINRKKKTYERKGPEDIFKVDCQKNTCIFSFDGKKLEYDIMADYKDTKEKVEITYTFGEEEKVMIITKGE